MKSNAKLYSLLCGLVTLSASLQAQHGVVREYAALAPKPDAVALKPLFETPLTDTSITRGADGVFYLTGSAFENGKPVASERFTIWQSTNLQNWRKLREIKPGPARYFSPELHFLKGKFWMTLEKARGGTELLRFDTPDLAQSAFQHAVITTQGITPSLFLDEDGTFYWLMGVGKIARMKANPMEGLAEEAVTIPVEIAGPPGQQSEQSVEMLRGAHLARIQGKYHLFVTGRLKRNGLGRTGLVSGVRRAGCGFGEANDGLR